jgi:hypothetical protein
VRAVRVIRGQQLARRINIRVLPVATAVGHLPL